MPRFEFMFLAVVASLCTVALGAHDTEDLRQGLTLYAPFEDTDLGAWYARGVARELMGGRDATRVEGKVGSAVFLTDKGRFKYATRENLDGMAATMSFWLRPDVGTLAKLVADSKGAFWSRLFVTTSWSTEGRAYVAFVRGNPRDAVSLCFYDWHPTGPQKGANKQLDVTDLEGWHHVVCQWGDGHKRLFLDGQLAEDTKADTGWRLGTRLEFSAAAGPTAYDELAIWNRILSADEVRLVYEWGQAGKRLVDKRPPVRPSDTSKRPLPGTNLLRNGGFELGLSGWELLYPPLRRADVVVKDGAAGSPRCLRVPPRPPTGRNQEAPRIVQGPFPIRGGQRHTLSISLKSDRAGAFATVFLAPVQDAPGTWANLRKRVALTEQWQNIELSDMAEGGEDCLAYFGVEFEGEGNGCWWADQAAVYEGDSATYQPAPNVQFALSTDKLANIFHKGDPIALRLEAWQPSDESSRATASETLTLSIEDFNDRQVMRADIPVRIVAGQVTERLFELSLESGRETTSRFKQPSGRAVAKHSPSNEQFTSRSVVRRFGPMRVVLLAGSEVLDELNFTVIPFTDAESDKLGQFLGGELNPNDWHCASAHALGLRWALPLDCSRATLWSHVEAVQGTFNWDRDGDIACYRQWGLNVLGWIDHAPKWAAATKAWKSVPARDQMDAFENYVYRTVEHYKDQVHDWLIWDEMDQQTSQRGGSVDLYMDMIERAYRAAHRADPRCRVVAPASSGNVGWVKSLVDRGLLQYTDVYSNDLWSTRYPTIARLAELSRADGKDRLFWDHGTGGASRTFYRYIFLEPKGTEDTGVSYRDGAVQLARHVIDRRAAGVEKMFFYWIVKQQCTPSHAAISFFEYDGSVRPLAAVFAILGQYLYQYEPVRPLATPANLTGFLFRAKADGAPLAVLYASRRGFVADTIHALRDTGLPARLAGDPRGVFVRLNTTLKPGEYVLHDMMLNPTAEGVQSDAKTLSVWIGETPILIEGRGLSVEAFEQRLVGAVAGD